MAQVNHNDYLDTINDFFSTASHNGVLHLQSSAGLVAGRKIAVHDGEFLNFGSLGYLALETDPRLIEGSIDYTRKFGTQSVMSRTYISTSIIHELEESLRNLFGRPVITYSRVSLAHVSLLPLLVDRKDAVILDQQAHFSIQSATQLLRQKGVTIDMIKHSNLDMLEKKIKEHRVRHRKVWYMGDGVYSMFGDTLPVKEVYQLMDKYPELWLYSDDAHGMSWTGDRGAGFVAAQGPLHERLILVTTMSKGFGAHGGIAVLPDEQLYERVRLFGGPLSYSLPLSPGDIGACQASANIHLSEEIDSLQQELKDRVSYCNELLDASGLPVLSNPGSPINFVGMGQPKVAYDMTRRLLDEDIYINPSFFPMVPVKSSGLRFGLTRNLRLEDIKKLIDAIQYHFPRSLSENGYTRSQVFRAFRIKEPETASPTLESITTAAPSPLEVEHHNSIQDMDTSLWNQLMGDFGTIDSVGMQFMEETFSGNSLPEQNWNFHYFVIRDGQGVPVLCTFLTEGVFKDDFITDPSISLQVEERRKDDPYYLTSKTLFSGSTISEGQHLYLDRKHPEWKRAFGLLLQRLWKLKEQTGAKKIALGDFEVFDQELKEIFLVNGFFKIDMPNTNISRLVATDVEEFVEQSDPQNRKNIKREAVRFEHCFEVECKSSLSPSEMEHSYELFLNVKQRNYGLNFFDYPQKILTTMSESPNWEFLVLRLGAEHDPRSERQPVAVLWCYKGKTHYSPMIIGMDYEFNEAFKVYKQALYRVNARAIELGMKKIYWGFSADTEKKKYGAQSIPKMAFIHTDDNFKLELMASMGVREADGAKKVAV